MRVEALSSYDSAIELSHSPPISSQENNLQEKFIQGKKDLVRDLVKSNPVELFFDAVSLYYDFWHGVVEHHQLIKDPIYHGEGVPHGDGSKWLYMGGFATWPWMFTDSLRTCQRIGFEPKAVWSGSNVGSIRSTARRLLSVIREEARESGRKVNVLGQSLGGLDWAAAFMEDPEMFVEYVDNLVLGVSPRPTRVNKALELAYLVIQWLSQEEGYDVSNGAELLKKAKKEGLMKMTQIDISNDPALDGEHWVMDEDYYVLDLASHSGLLNNRDFFRLMAYRTAGEEIEGLYPQIHHKTKVA